MDARVYFSFFIPLERSLRVLVYIAMRATYFLLISTKKTRSFNGISVTKCRKCSQPNIDPYSWTINILNINFLLNTKSSKPLTSKKSGE